MTIEALRKSLQSPYGIQSLNTHDVVAAIEEFDRLQARVAELERSNAMIKADAILEAVEEYKREYCGQGIERLFLDYANQIEGE